jgi:hypothetical protein
MLLAGFCWINDQSKAVCISSMQRLGHPHFKKKKN